MAIGIIFWYLMHNMVAYLQISYLFFVKTRRWQSEANAHEAEICECDTEQSFQDTKTVYEQ